MAVKRHLHITRYTDNIRRQRAVMIAEIVAFRARGNARIILRSRHDREYGWGETHDR